jgi:Zn-dependent M28 family amino/carboxypeptidase
MMMKKIKLAGLSILAIVFASGQKPENMFSSAEVVRIEKVLASDDMMGRSAFSPYIDKAAGFIADEFEKAGLDPMPGNNGYRQEFSILRAQLKSQSVTVNGEELPTGNLIVITSGPVLNINEKSGYDKVFVRQGDDLNREARNFVRSGKNLVVLVDNSFSERFSRLTRLRSALFKSAGSVIFLLTDTDPVTFEVKATHEISETKMANVVGMIPGKSRKDEYVVFSAHYDHIGTGKPVDGDSIFNGANDDAAGTTAVMMLAKYFKGLNNNERTLIFAAFTAEERGGYGSRFFSEQFEPDRVIAMFNIEMIGTESKWGENAAYITGYEKTDMGKIMQKNLEGSGFTFHPDPYPGQQLFYRSDNATLARLGVPAHTISTAKMDGEPHYHKLSDEIGTLDLENMAMIIKSIAISARSIIAGKDTPSRVNTQDLR